MDDVLDLTRITRKWAKVTVTATDADGAPIAITGVSFAVLPHAAEPTDSTTWTNASTFTADVATVLLAGPNASPTGAVVVPVGLHHLWARVVDSQETDVVKVKRLRVK